MTDLSNSLFDGTPQLVNFPVNGTKHNGSRFSTVVKTRDLFLKLTLASLYDSTADSRLTIISTIAGCMKRIHDHRTNLPFKVARIPTLREYRRNASCEVHEIGVLPADARLCMAIKTVTIFRVVPHRTTLPARTLPLRL